MSFSAKIIFILFVGSAVLFAKDIKKDFNHLFTINKDATLFLECGDGDVDIQTWDKDQIQVEVIYHATSKSSSGRDESEFDVEFRQNGHNIYVIGHEQRRNNFGFFSIHYVEYRFIIKTPVYVNIDIVGDDGDIHIENISGEIKIKSDDGKLSLANIANKKTVIKTEDGDVRIDELSGEVFIRADDGDIFLQDLKADEVEVSSSDGRIKIINSEGDFFIDSDDGDVTLNNISGKELSVRTKDGDVDINFSGSGMVDVDVNTNDGRVNVELENQISAKFTLETDDGRIRFNVDKADIIYEGKRRVKGSFGDAEGHIRINTNDGSITLND